MKKFLSIFMVVCLFATFMSACTKEKENTPNNGAATVRFLNFKPEVAQVYDEIAKAYKEAEKMLKLEKKQIPEEIEY